MSKHAKARYYETLFLLSTQATEDEIAFLQENLTSYITEAQGSLKQFDKWGKYRLAYEIRKQNYGQYILARYEINDYDEFFRKLDALIRVKCNTFVYRFVSVNLTEEKYAADYIKPEPVTSQEGDVDSFIQKKQGFFGDRRSDRRAEKVEAAPAKEQSVAAEQETANA